MRRSWIALAIGVPAVALLALSPAARRAFRSEVTEGEGGPAIARPVKKAEPAPPPPPLTGLDLTKIRLGKGGATAPLAGKKTAHLTLDPALQRTAVGLMKRHHVPEAVVVLLDVETGKVLVYASYLESGAARDLAVVATAPAASVFKIVTGTALVEHAGLGPDHKECYSGGEHRIQASDLVRDPKRDRWCATLSSAMGRSLNTVFARLALDYVKAPVLEQTARGLGFGHPIPFDVPVQASSIELPAESLGYARTSAGFWNTTLSPLHAAFISAAVARGGEPVRPYVVSEVADAEGRPTWKATPGRPLRRAMTEETAQAVTSMMESTVSGGTSYRAFRDPNGREFLPGISIAGKTGTLTDHAAQRFYTWFTGFAPSHPYAPPPAGTASPPRQVAIGVLVVNEAKWTVKANVLAREVLRAYFAEEKAPGVSSPMTRARQPSTTPGTKQRRQRGS
jgi:penicillin-binding protein A